MINYKRIWLAYVCCCLFCAVGIPDLEWLMSIEEEPINLEMPEVLLAVFDLDIPAQD